MSEDFGISQIDEKNLVAFHKVWKECSAQSGGGLPHRDLLNLKALGALAQHTMLYSFQENGDLVILRSGTAVDEWWGSNMSGLRCEDLLSPETYQQNVDFHTRLIKEKRAGFVHEWLSHKGGAKLECLSLVLPLSSKKGFGHTMSLSSLRRKDYSGHFEGIYQDLATREVVELRYFSLLTE